MTREPPKIVPFLPDPDFMKSMKKQHDVMQRLKVDLIHRVGVDKAYDIVNECIENSGTRFSTNDLIQAEIDKLPPTIVITGSRGSGKSSLLAWIEECPNVSLVELHGEESAAISIGYPATLTKEGLIEIQEHLLGDYQLNAVMIGQPMVKELIPEDMKFDIPFMEREPSVASKFKANGKPKRWK